MVAAPEDRAASLCQAEAVARAVELLQEMAEAGVNACRQLVEMRLASSAHVIAPIVSIYRWEDSVHEHAEARAFLRSRGTLVAALVQYVGERHPYQVPNVTVLPIVGGNPEYLAWVLDETDEPSN